MLTVTLEDGAGILYYNFQRVRIHSTALKHGVGQEAIEHALRNPRVVVDLDPDGDPPRILAIGPDHSGILLEIIALELSNEGLVIHAMRLRSAYRSLLQAKGEPR